MAVKQLSEMYSVKYKTFALFVLALVLVSTFAGCTNLPFSPIDPKLYPSGAAYTYQPLNPTTVWIRDPFPEEVNEGYLDADETSYEFNKALLRDLDTETVRVALTTLEGKATLDAGVVGTSVKGQSYVLIVDYIKYITSGMEIDTEYTSINAKGQGEKKCFVGTVPMYTGIGLRIRAEFKALEGKINISGLPAIAAAANAKGISGRLTVQTLGITGQEVTGLMPLISDISITSIQNAVQAVGAIKAKIYEESTTVYPKIVAFESPERDPALIRAITEIMYASEEYICPTIIKNPQDPNKTILWIDWFTQGQEEKDCQKDEMEDETEDGREDELVNGQEDEPK